MRNIIDFFKQTDKQKHAVFSFLLTLATFFILNVFTVSINYSVIFSFLAVSLIGFSKEIWDYYGWFNHKGTADVYDLIADLIGTLLAELILIITFVI